MVAKKSWNDSLANLFSRFDLDGLWQPPGWQSRSDNAPLMGPFSGMNSTPSSRSLVPKPLVNSDQQSPDNIQSDTFSGDRTWNIARGLPPGSDVSLANSVRLSNPETQGRSQDRVGKPNEPFLSTEKVSPLSTQVGRETTAKTQETSLTTSIFPDVKLAADQVTEVSKPAAPRAAKPPAPQLVSATLDQWANGPAPDADGTGQKDEVWVNGNLNTTKAHYNEGDAIPYRALLDNLVKGTRYGLEIQWDTVDSGASGYAVDYLVGYNFSFEGLKHIGDPADPLDDEPDVNPLKNGNGGIGLTGVALALIPEDQQLLTGFGTAYGSTDGLGSTQPSGQQYVSLYGGVTGQSVGPISYSSDFKKASTTIWFTYDGTANPNGADVVVAWGGHIAAATAWADDPGETVVTASDINGSPYHMRLLSMAVDPTPSLSGDTVITSIGNQDRSLSADAVMVYTPPALTNTPRVLDDEILLDGIKDGDLDGIQVAGVTEDPDPTTSPSSGTSYTIYGSVDNSGAVNSDTTLLIAPTLPANSGFTYQLDPGGRMLSILQEQGGVDTKVIQVTLANATGVAGGAYEVVHKANILHAAGQDENDLQIGINYRVTYYSANGIAQDGSLLVYVDDDIPGLMEAEADGIVEDENISSGIDEDAGVGGDPTPDYTAVVEGNVSNNGLWGADTFAALTSIKIGSNDAVEVASGSDGVTLYWSQVGVYQGTTATDAAASLNVKADGTYKYTLLDNLLLGTGIEGEQIDTLASVSFTGKDKDGDTASIDLLLKNKDDIPGLMEAEADGIVEDENISSGIDEDAGVGGDPTPDYTAVVEGNVSNNGLWGADTFAALTSIKIGSNDAVEVASGSDGVTLYWSQVGVYQGTTATDAAASLNVKADGTYKYTLLDNLLLGTGIEGEQIDTLASVSFTGKDKDGDTASIDLLLKNKDDIPGLMEAEADGIVEDENISSGIDEDAGVGGDPTPDYTAVVEGNVSNNGLWGADTFAALTSIKIGSNDAVEVASGSDGVTLYWSQVGVYQGTTATDAAASLNVKADGTYKYTLLDNLLLGTGIEGEQIDTLASVSFTGKDKDGDTASIDLLLKNKDDIPGLMEAEADGIVEDENISSGIDEDAGVGGDPTPDYTAVVEGNVSNNGLWGADTFAALTSIKIGSNDAVEVASGSDGVTLYWSQVGVYQGTTATDAAASLNVKADGTYKYTLLDNLLLGTGIEGEQIDTLASVSFTGKDKDGDTASIDLLLKNKDDIPGLMEAEADGIVEDENISSGIDEDAGVGGDPTPDYTAVVEGNVSNNGLWGADTFAALTSIKIGSNDAVEVASGSDGVTLYWSQVGVYQGTTATDAAASLNVKADGTYKYTLLDNLLLGTGIEGEQIDTLASVSFTGKDKDGDTASIDLLLKNKDDIPGLMEAEADGIVEDENISSGIDEDAGVGGDPTPDYTAVVEGNVSNNGLWGADTFAALTSIKIGSNDAVEVASGSDGVTLYWSQVGVYQGTTATDAAASLNVKADGTYKYTLLDNLLLGTGIEGEQIDTLASVSFTGKDKDGDTASIDLLLKNKDDIPGLMEAEADGIVEDENISSGIDEDAGVGGDPTPDYTAVVEGNVSNNGLWGADTFAALTSIKIGSNDAVEVASGSDGVTLYWSQVGVYQGTTATDAAASLNVKADGTYKYTLLDNLLLGTGIEGEQIDTLASVSFTGKDKDGDTASIDLLLKNKDDIPEILSAPTQDASPVIGQTTWTYSGHFDYAIGADKRSIYSGSGTDFVSLELSGSANDTAIVAPSIVWLSETSEQAVFKVSFGYDDDWDLNTAAKTVNGALTFDKVDGTYSYVFDALATQVDFTLGGGTGYASYPEGSTTPKSGPQPVATGQLGEGFFIQVTGFTSPLTAGSSITKEFEPGELISGLPDAVTLSRVALGVSGNTIQRGEAADIQFFSYNPYGQTSSAGDRTISDLFLKFDGFETEDDDLVVVLELAKASDPLVITTRAIYVDQGDAFENDDYASLIGTPYEAIVANDPADSLDPFMDNNDALVIIESNDYNFAPYENWVIKTVQVLSSADGITGDAINLNRDVGSSGASIYDPIIGLVDDIGDDASANPLKIIDAGFTSIEVTPPALDLTIDFQVADADGDTTLLQAIEVHYPVAAPPMPSNVALPPGSTEPLGGVSDVLASSPLASVSDSFNSVSQQTFI